MADFGFGNNPLWPAVPGPVGSLQRAYLYSPGSIGPAVDTLDLTESPAGSFSGLHSGLSLTDNPTVPFEYEVKQADSQGNYTIQTISRGAYGYLIGGVFYGTPAASDRIVTVDEIRRYLRADDLEDDQDLLSLIVYASDFVQRETGRQLLTAKRVLYLDRFPGQDKAWCRGRAASPLDRVIRLPYPPLQAVTFVKYVIGGVETVFDPSNYTVDAEGEPGRIVLNGGASWPATDDVANAVRISFTCGYTDATAVPNLLKQAVKWIVGHAYENRNPINFGSKLEELPFAVRAVIESMMFREAIGA